jgi:NDP-sugar pyrophosphorylase family protein
MGRLKDIDALLLCGGLGTRLRSVISDKPKPLALIDGRPFLDIIIDYLYDRGIRRFVLAVGYMAEAIERQYRDGKKDSRIVFSRENQPLGTAGAVKNAQALIKSPDFLVMNADSFSGFDPDDFLRYHLDKKALVSIALVNNPLAKEVGRVRVDGSGKIISFSEKKERAPGENLVNAGIYLFNERIFKLIPADIKFSLENDLFPGLDNCYGYVIDNALIDIGTPEGYAQAKLALGQSKKKICD